EREPITVVLSEKGWLRALKGHHDDLARLEFKQGDKLKAAVHAHTTDKILIFATNGRFFTLAGDQLPGGRGHGEPLRLMIDLEENHAPVHMLLHDPERYLLVASAGGYGFAIPEADVVASTRKGKQILNVAAGDEARHVVPVPDGADRVATVGSNRKLLIFDLEEVNELTRGKGTILQRLKDTDLADIRAFKRSDGLSWQDAAGRTFVTPLSDLKDWVGTRAQAGKVAPKGFPRNNCFGPHF
ncbi:MAG: DNA gyrase C-terminal beta-propeller domain-containing protein, partial [Pseudomonadota bacterium]